MRRLRFSLLGLFGVVTLAAVNFAALRYVPEWWAASVFTVAVGAVLVAVLGAWFQRGAARAFWAGFGFVSGAYLTVVFGPWFDVNVGRHLVTSSLLRFAYRVAEGAWREASELAAVLDRPASFDFEGVPLRAAVQFLAEDLRVDIEVDRSLEERINVPVSYHASRVPLESALSGLLSGAGATHWVADGSVVIGTPEAAPRRRAGFFASVPSAEVIERGGHACFALLFGLLGGVAAGRFYRKRAAAPHAATGADPS